MSWQSLAGGLGAALVLGFLTHRLGLSPIVGYLLAGITSTVIELNMDAVRALRQDGVDAIYGDATRPDTLEAAGIGKAGSLILGSAGMANSADVIRMARAINPDLKVLARAPYLRDVPALNQPCHRDDAPGAPG